MTTPRKVSASNGEKITQQICAVVVKDYMPLNIVEGVAFRELMDSAFPNYKLPCRNTFRVRIVQNYENDKQRLISELKSTSSVAITTDTWISNATESYIIVTEHHMDGS